ncbi:ABC transporter permease [Salipaludibacillus agaradhaerens]|jgi:ABC-2 type transport system permease protein|uniref:ABC transporter permease n=1 Tax=Salipaludibacillus agaradhaerens TaxID=76935 RepID=UPI0021510D5B|nr:ABC transporter permease [Salipaludibacillus agaradhaerens]MCR6105156.1 ABC transporter permease [Salipaludibacillus agaradhaerens]MCR6117201.1 ABC transporter permease [Salipaludibacillus agaradhaerens]UJW56396.1 ABC transporter permease [Bacillus sp. A116_S68]
MRNSLKVAKWEVKRNLKHKSFLISLFLTPLIFIFFFTVPTLFQGSDDDQEELIVDVYVTDELGVTEDIERLVQDMANYWVVHRAADSEQALEEVKEAERAVYLPLTEENITSGTIDVFASEELGDSEFRQLMAIEPIIKAAQLEEYGFTDDEVAVAVNPIALERQSADTSSEMNENDIDMGPSFERIIPAGFAGLILFSVVITGMMIFQSASQEKKEKVAEMVLSSLTPTELMQGKIIGYFALGLIQSIVWIGVASPIIVWRFDLPVMTYLFVPELAVLIFIALAGYLLFAAIFVGIGATVEDMTASSNFQGLIFMLPWLPFILIGPILHDPEGLIAQVGSFIPVTAPGVLLIRLAILEEWPWIELILALVVLVISIWLLMKLAGKIFKTGILMYGKNATPKEIWKWMRQ